MPARQLRDQLHLIHWRNNAVTIDDEVKFKKNQFSKQTGYTSNISIPYDGQKNHYLELFLDPSHNKPSRAGKDIVTSVFRRCKFDPSPLTRSLIFGKNTAICRSCVQVQSHELRMSLHFPKIAWQSFVTVSQRYSKTKTRFSPLHKEKTILLWSWRSQNPEMILVLPF